eukprot:CAMPEP_0171406972 /NCGR_PEP_ID=MMETSP0880-20121228/18871_1 /TAXON_ID=67004 /ORGANISM="Thalassiosira weissflogii, Strain CCMP1336" /LENGTH=198 /DNA_ID=CAMNT_0011922803 /DNA_START=64 /DNA_END=660 /DNA_ORIENTATION=+
MASSLIVPPSGPVTAHCFRLQPGDQLMPTLKQAASVVLSRMPPDVCGSAFIITAVGSLQDVTLRLANASRSGAIRQGNAPTDENFIKRYPQQRFEIVSLTGTFSRDDGCHVHISLSDAEGNTVGGHLIDGFVFTTVEIVMGTANGVIFRRVLDERTGYNELEVRQIISNRKRESVLARLSLSAILVVIGFLAGRCRSR